MNHPRCSDCPIAGRCVVSWTAHTPFCDWARRGGAWRKRVEELSAAGPPETAEYPSLIRQAKNLAGAAVRFAASGFKLVDPAELERRKAICAACPHWDAGPKRCVKCGCKTNAKLRIAAESCPDNPPRWLAVIEPPESPSGPE